MKGIEGLLSRFRDFTPPDASLRRAVAGAVREVAGIVVSFQDVSVKNNTAYVNVPPVAKSEIALNKAAILRRVSESLGSHTLVRDIR